MDAVLQKAKADILSRPLISILVITTIAAASTLLTLALITLMNISAPYDKSFADLNGAHLWLYFNRERIRARDIAWIEHLPQVTESTGLQYSVENRVRIGNTRVKASLRAMPADMPAVNRLLIHEGRYLSSSHAEVIANEELNYYYHLALGDPVGITGANGKEVHLPVVGVVYNPTWDIYRNSQSSYIYLTEKTMRDLFPDETTWDWSIGLRLADPQAVTEVYDLIKSKLRSDTIDSYTDWRDVKTSAIFEGQLNFVFLGAFSIFAVLAVMLVVASSISSIVLSQFKQIGMLKAIGFTKNQIVWLYMGQYLGLSFVGTGLGLVGGVVLSPLPLQSVAVSLNTTFQPGYNSLLVILVFSIVPGVVILATMGAAYRGANANIIKAIAVGAEAPPHKPFWAISIAARLGLPLLMVLGLNEVFARPFRSFLTGLNLTLGVIGIVFGLALNETLDAYIADPSLLGIVYDAVVTREETSDSRTRHLLQTAPGVEAFYGEELVDVETLAGQSFQMRAVTGDLAAFPVKVSEGHFFQPQTYEAVAGRGLLDWLGVKVGDEVTLIVDDQDNRPITWRIVGQYAESSNAGQMLMVDMSTLARALGHPQPTTYYLKLRPGSDRAALKQYLEPDQDADLNLTLIERAIPESIVYLQVAIFALATVLIGIALVNVFNTSLLSVQEKLRTIGALKTVGMTPSQVVAMVNTTAGFLGLLAACFGIPLGLAFTQGMLASLSESYGIGEVNVNLKLLHALVIIPLMIGVSMIGSLIPARQAAKISIVQVLRNE